MVPLADLWLPILLSAVVVFIASSIMHMVLPYHRGDYKRLPDEDRVLEAMRSVRPGFYAFPFSGSMKEMGTPAMMEKYKRGPVGTVTVVPSGPPAMPKLLTMWFVYSVLIGVLVAYLAGRTMAPGTEFPQVFRIVGTAGVLAYAVAHISDFIWRGRPWGMTIKELIDGLVYGLLTGAVFAWLWPR